MLMHFRKTIQIPKGCEVTSLNGFFGATLEARCEMCMKMCLLRRMKSVSY